MNEQAIQDSYNVFVKQGYTKGIEDYKKLIASNPEALQDSYNAFVNEGYNNSINDYKALMGLAGAPKAAPTAAPITAQAEPLKKKESSITALPSENTFLASQKQLPNFEVSPLREEAPVVKEPLLKNKQAFEKATDRNEYLDNLSTGLISGLNTFEKMVASAPESAYDIIGIVPNYLLQKAGLDLEMSSDKLKSTLGITNPLLNKLNEEEKALKERTAEYNKKYETTGIVDNFQKGNYQDGFELLGRSIVENAPTSIAMMVGGATVTAPELFAASTTGFFKQNQEQLAEENPNMSNVEKNIKALAMASAETVFESIGEGTIGKVYKDIVKKEGEEVGKVVFRDGLVKMYETALKKFGAPIGLLGEGLGEAATQITQNIISDKPAFEGAADAFVTGAGSGVMFTAPISALKARDKVRGMIETSKSKEEIGAIIGDKEKGLDQVYNVPVETSITPEQLKIANTNDSRNILMKDLTKKVKKGDISEADAKQSLYIFDKIQQVSNNVKDLAVTDDEKAEIATLLSKRNDLTTQIQNKDDVLVVKEKQQIQDINTKIQDIILASKPEVKPTTEQGIKVEDRIKEIENTLSPDNTEIVTPEERTKLETELQTLKTQQNAIQEQSTSEGLLRTEQPEMGLPKVGEGNQGPQVITTGTEEKITPEGGTQKVNEEDLLQQKEDTELARLNDEVSKAQSAIGTAEDVTEAAKLFIAAKNTRDAYQTQIEDRRKAPIEAEKINSLIEDQKEDSQKEGYEYTELYNKDPRLAAVQHYKDLLDFVSTPEYVQELIKMGDTEESAKESQARSIESNQRNIDLLNKNLEANPIKEVVTKRAPAPTTKKKLVENAKKALKSVFPDMPIHMFNNMTDIRSWFKEKGASQAWINRNLVNLRGAAISDENGNPKYIILNNSNYASTTLPHEIWHVLLAKAFGKTTESQVIFKGFRESIEKTLREGGYNDVADKLAEHAEQDIYKKNKKVAEEWLVQFGAYMTQSGLKIGELNPREQNLLNKIKEIVNKYAIKLFDTPIFLEEATPDNVLQFITTMSDSLRRGEDLNKYFKPISTSEKGGVSIDQENAGDAKGVQDHIYDLVKLAKKNNTDKDILTAKVIKYLVNSDAYKNATEEQRSEMYKNAKEAISSIEKAAPKVKVELKPTANKVTVNEMTALKDQIRKEATAAKEGAKSINDSVKAITEYFNSIKDRANLTRKDLNNVIKTISSIKNQETLDKAADKIFDIVKNANTDIIEVSEAKALKSQIKLEAKAAKEAKADLNTKRKRMASLIKEMQKTGKLTVAKATALINRVNSINLDNPEAVDRFVDYAEKVYNDADYAAKLTTAVGLRSALKSLSNNKDKNANLRNLATQFAKIDPSMVDDIEEYNKIAAAIKEATKGSSTRGGKPLFAQTVKIENVMEYVKDTIEAQNEELRQRKADEIQELMGVDVSDLSYEDMMSFLDNKENIKEYDEGIIRSTINKLFGIYASVINETIKTGKDPVTGEAMEFTENQKSLVNRFMAMDLNMLTPREALKAVDSLNNFLTNGSVAGMEAVLADYKGEIGAQKLVNKGIKSSKLQKYFIPSLGRLLTYYTKDLNLVFEQMFPGFNKSGLVEKLMGVSDIIKGNATAKSISDRILNQYVKAFYKTNPNGEKFNTAYNDVERQVIARTIRTVFGTDSEVQADFNRRKELIAQAIDELKNGNEEDVITAELTQQAYDKLLKDSESIEDVKSKADAINLDAVQFWIDNFSDIYDKLAETSESVYNKVLERENNYTPDRFINTTEAVEDKAVLDPMESAFHTTTNNIYKKESGVLMKATRPTAAKLKGKKYLSMSFDKNMANTMRDALVDIHTAAPIRTAYAFLNSDNYKKIVTDQADRKLLRNRVALYVRNMRKKTIYQDSEFADALKKMNRVAALGAAQALGSLGMPVKQAVPVIVNTLINSGNFDTTIWMDKDKNAFLSRSGYSIANRGEEVQTQIDSLNKRLSKAANSNAAKALEIIENTNKWWLHQTLVRFDVAVARASWMTYYEQNLKKQGIDVKSINYKTHELNQEAADYAERMVSRQQKSSDSDLAGAMFVSKNPSTQFLVKMMMPFAAFRMNQSARLTSDLTTLYNKAVSSEDRMIAIRSLAGFGAEMATFKLASAGLQLLWGTVANAIMGRDEDDEEWEKRKAQAFKNQRTSAVTDVFSPVPILDQPVQDVADWMLTTVQDFQKTPENERFSINKVGKFQNYIKNLGMFGIGAQRAYDLAALTNLATTGKYTDDFGKEKTISEKDMNGLKQILPFVVLSDLGFLPMEPTIIAKNAIKIAKTKEVTPEEKAQKQANIEKKAAEVNTKITALENLKEKTYSDEEIKAIDEKLRELTADTEEKKQIKQEHTQEKQAEKSLLYDSETGRQYDNQSDLKKYNPGLYNRNFGKGSDWYQEHRYEQNVDKKLSKEVNKIEEEKMGYRKARKTNSDGTPKRMKPLY